MGKGNMLERYGGVKMEEQKRKFAGVWIPKEIYLNKELSWTEKIQIGRASCRERV